MRNSSWLRSLVAPAAQAPPRPCARPAQAPRRDFGRPILGGLFDEYRPQFTGGLARLARGTVFHNGYQSHAATETCPGHSTILTGDRPADRDHRQHLVRSVARRAPTRRLLRRGRDARRAPLDRTTRFRPAFAGADARRAAEAARPGQPQGRGRGQGPRGGDDGRPASRPALVLGRQASSPPTSRAPRSRPALPRPTQASRQLDRQPRTRARAAAVLCRQRRSRITHRGQRQDGRHRPLRARRRRRRGLPRLPGVRRRRRWRSRQALVQEMKLGRGPAPDLLAIGLRRPTMSATPTALAARRCASSCSSLDRDLGDFFALLDRTRNRLCGGADRRSWRPRYPGAAAAARRGRSGAVDPALGADGVGKRIGAELSLAGPVLYRRVQPATSIVDQSLPRPTATRVLDARAGDLSRPSAGRGGVHQRTRSRELPMPAGARRLDADRARPRLLRSAAIGRPGRRAQAATSRRSPMPRMLCRDPWQPVGLRPPRADPVLAAGHGAERRARTRSRRSTSCRPWRRCSAFRSPPGRSTGIASAASTAWLARTR